MNKVIFSPPPIFPQQNEQVFTQPREKRSSTPDGMAAAAAATTTATTADANWWGSTSVAGIANAIGKYVRSINWNDAAETMTTTGARQIGDVIINGSDSTVSKIRARAQ